MSILQTDCHLKSYAKNDHNACGDRFIHDIKQRN